MMRKYAVNKNCGVYMIECKINKKKYIGSSVDIYNRKYTHISSLRGGYHRSKSLQKDFYKFKANNFKFKILKLCSKEKLLDYEEFYMHKYKSFNKKFGYNSVKLKDGKNIKSKDMILNQIEGQLLNKNYIKFLPEMIKLKQSGYSYNKIADLYNMYSSTVYNLLNRRTDLKFKKLTTRKYQDVYKEWIILKKQGYTYTEIGELYGVAISSIHYSLSNYTSEIFPKISNKRNIIYKYDNLFDEWMKLKNIGYSYQKIAKIYKVNAMTISKYFKRKDFKIE